MVFLISDCKCDSTCNRPACVANRQKTKTFIQDGLLSGHLLRAAIRFCKHLYVNHLLSFTYPYRSKLCDIYFCIEDLIDLVQAIVFRLFSHGHIEHYCSTENGLTTAYTCFVATFRLPIGSFIKDMHGPYGSIIPTTFYQYTGWAIFVDRRHVV